MNSEKIQNIGDRARPRQQETGESHQAILTSHDKTPHADLSLLYLNSFALMVKTFSYHMKPMLSLKLSQSLTTPTSMLKYELHT